MKRLVITAWIVGSVLVAIQLMFSAAFDVNPRFWLFLCVLLACYSLPFFFLSIIRIPQGRSPQRYILLTLFALVIGTNLFIPVNCLLPSHHPKALEPLGYIFLPLFELVVIALFIVAAIASDLLLRKDRKS